MNTKTSPKKNAKAPVKKDQTSKTKVKAKAPSVETDKAPVKMDHVPVKTDQVLFEINIEGCPSDFWESHTPSDPKTLFDSKTNEGPIKHSLLLFKERFSIDLSKNGRYIDVRGNGFCGFYAIMWNIFKQYTEIHDIDHELFLEQISPIMKQYSILEKRPNDIDADVLCNIMEEYLKIYYAYIMYPSFAVFSLDDVTYKFKATSNNCNNYMKNLITIVHSYGHFKALIYPERRKIDIYKALVEDSTKIILK